MTVRLVPDVPFPRYTFVPGESPHPVSDPNGHSFGIEPPVPPELTAEQWSKNRTYLYGLDLFNAGYFWESHVEFESLWLACGRKGAIADFLKGLIQLAAAGVKHLEGTLAGVTSHCQRAADLWRHVAASLPPGLDVFLGLRLMELIEVASAASQHGWPTKSPLLMPVL
jgi:hypothetical protein